MPMPNFVWARNPMKFNVITMFGLVFDFGVFFGKYVLPEGLATQTPKMLGSY